MEKEIKKFLGVGRCFGDEKCKEAKRAAGKCVYSGLEPRKRRLK